MKEILQLLDPYIRCILTNATCMVIGYRILHYTAGNRGPRWPGVVYVVYKVVLMNTIFRYLLGPFCEGEMWWHILIMCMEVLNVLINMWVFRAMFCGSLVKVLIIEYASELFVIFIYFSANSILNLLRGLDLEMIYAPFHPIELLGPVIMWGIWGVLRLLLNPLLKKLYHYEPNWNLSSTVIGSGYMTDISYKISGNQITVKNNSYSIELGPILEEYTNYTFLQARRTFKTYTSAGGSTVSFTVESGDWIELLKIAGKNGTAYYQFQNLSGKKGWLKESYSYSKGYYFYDLFIAG